MDETFDEDRSAGATRQDWRLKNLDQDRQGYRHANPGGAFRADLIDEHRAGVVVVVIEHRPCPDRAVVVVVFAGVQRAMTMRDRVLVVVVILALVDVLGRRQGPAHDRRHHDKDPDPGHHLDRHSTS